MSQSTLAIADDLTDISLIDVGLDPAEAYEKGKVDINFFAALALPSVFLFPFPYFYTAAWQLLVQRNPKYIGKIFRFALGLPRGHAKTTFIKVIIAWLIVYDKVSFVLIVCANDTLAQQVLADINDILGSPNIEAIYGQWTNFLSTDSIELKKASYHRRPVTIAARGVNAALRGLNIKHSRPDLVFLDDAQTRENDESPTERTTLLRVIVATILKLLSPRGDRWVIYVGNMYSEDCILKKLQDNPGWVSLITGAILDTGVPLWPELFSLEDLMESFYHDEALGLEDVWFSEIMNDPKSSARSLLKTNIPKCPYDPIEIIPDGVFLTIDPANFKELSDSNIIDVHYVFDGKGIVVERKDSAKDHELTNPEELIKCALRLAIQHGASLIGVEDVGYQQSLQFWFNKYIVEFNIVGLVVVPLNPHGRSKEARIRQFISELLLENYYLAEGETRANFVWQASKYKIGAAKNRDDILDADAYGLDVRNEYWELVTNLKTQFQALPLAVVQDDNTPF